MWPWRRRVEVVLAASAGDDATAALTMILRYHRKPVTFDEVRQAIYQDRSPPVTALDLVHAAEQFRLRARGLAVADPSSLTRLPTPTIAHVMPGRGTFPRPRDGDVDGYFAVVVAISPQRIRWIDPYTGEIDDEHGEFVQHASGVFLVFDAAEPIPRARLSS
jgi:ABC-type bacteriocin/lantibiotic exporter with double-glycine peptidase domain